MDIAEKNARIVRQARKIEELDDERNAALDRAEKAEALIASQARRIEELEAALSPFAFAYNDAVYTLDGKVQTLGVIEAVAKYHLAGGAFQRASLINRTGEG